MLKPRRLFTATLLIFLGLYILNIARFAGVYVSYEPTSIEGCTQIILPGAEDFVSISGEGILISAVDRKAHDPNFIDGIYWLANEQEPVLVSLDAPATFHPHGLSLWQDETQTLLYAVSHDGDLYSEDEGHSIEVFEWTDERQLLHRRSIRHPEIRSPNDLAVVGIDQFYVSNDWYFLKGFMRTVEQYLLLPITNVIYYDNGEAKEAAAGLRYANGVTASFASDGVADRLYVSEVMGRSVNQYAIDPVNAELQHTQTYRLGGSPDNISIDDQGRLLVAVIHDGFAFNDFSSGRSDAAPALIRRLDPASGEIDDVFYREDGYVSGATSGLMHDGKLFIGTAYDDKLVACPMPG